MVQRKYCWWKKSCTTWNVKNLQNHGIDYQPQLFSWCRISSIHCILSKPIAFSPFPGEWCQHNASWNISGWNWKTFSSKETQSKLMEEIGRTGYRFGETPMFDRVSYCLPIQLTLWRNNATFSTWLFFGKMSIPPKTRFKFKPFSRQEYITKGAGILPHSTTLLGGSFSFAG